MTSRTSKLPLFHTQVIGSLPRPKLVLDLLNRRGEIAPERFTKIMDEMVTFAIRLQEQAGIDVISDGEWRRRHYIREFLNRVGGCEPVRSFEHQGQKKYTDVIVKRMQPGDPVFVRDAQFLVDHTDRRTKFALPSPFLIMIRYWHEAYSGDAYATPEHYMEHLTQILAAEARALAQTGIDVIQIDDPALTYFCDRRLMAKGQTHDDRLRQHWDIDKQMPLAVAAINQIAEAVLNPTQIHLHCCHSVYKRRSDVTGDYKPILPRLNEARIHRINLEFAYQETGQIDDLKLLPDHVGVGMGVVDVRGERIQTVEQIEQIAAAGAKLIKPDRIALNPDCGFAPDAGEPPTIDEAFEKLSRLSTAAARLRKKHTSTTRSHD